MRRLARFVARFQARAVTIDLLSDNFLCDTFCIGKRCLPVCLPERNIQENRLTIEIKKLKRKHKAAEIIWLTK